MALLVRSVLCRALPPRKPHQGEGMAESAMVAGEIPGLKLLQAEVTSRSRR